MIEDEDSNDQNEGNEPPVEHSESPDEKRWQAAVTERKRVEQHSDGRDLIS